MENDASYAAGLIAAFLMGAGYYSSRARADGLKNPAILLGFLIALPLRFLLSRAFAFFTQMHYLLPAKGWISLLDLRPQGLSYIGAIAGLMLGGYISERVCRLPRHKLLDPMASGVLVFIVISRLAEVFVSTGQGSFVENSALHFFPLAVQNEWGEWYFAVFMLEALFAFLILWDVQRKPRPAGERWRLTLFYFFCSQMLCESLRAEVIKWGFVRVQQLFCAIGAASMLATWVVKAARRGVKRSVWLLPACLLPCVIALMIGLEFALDRWQNTPRWALYMVMALVLAGFAGAGVSLLKAEESDVNVSDRAGFESIHVLE